MKMQLYCVKKKYNVISYTTNYSKFEQNIYD